MTIELSCSTFLASVVVRASQKGEMHGALYLVDFNNGTVKSIIHYEEMDISWEGSGGERGLRGIAVKGDRVYLATHNQIIQYDMGFQPVSSYSNPYLGQIHEIALSGDSLWITSTSFDSVLELDLNSGRFIKGYCLRNLDYHKPSKSKRWWDYAIRRLRRYLDMPDTPELNLRRFDPETSEGPRSTDGFHVNNVCVQEDTVYVSPGAGNRLYGIRNDSIEVELPIPVGSHNAQPYGGGILLNDTVRNRIIFTDIHGVVRELYEHNEFPDSDLVRNDLPDRLARPYFGRGLVTLEDGYFVVGCSPATVSLYREGDRTPLHSVNITKDVRCAVHGLSVFPSA